MGHIRITHLCGTVQEEHKFLQQRVEALQAELEVFAERSRLEQERLSAELSTTQRVSCTLTGFGACMT